jgi:hypothetical protein
VPAQQRDPECGLDDAEGEHRTVGRDEAVGEFVYGVAREFFDGALRWAGV